MDRVEIEISFSDKDWEYIFSFDNHKLEDIFIIDDSNDKRCFIYQFNVDTNKWLDDLIPPAQSLEKCALFEVKAKRMHKTL